MNNNLQILRSLFGTMGRATTMLWQSVIMLTFATFIFACNINIDVPKKHDPNDTIPKDTLPADTTLTAKIPVIVSFGVHGSDTTVIQYSKLSFAPVVESKTELQYKWMIGSDSVGNEDTFAFMTDKEGQYTLTFTARNSVGEASRSVVITVKNLPTSGFYIINEGWFGHDMGSVNSFNPLTSELLTNVYGAANAPLELGNTTCYGSIWDNKIYLISKQGRRLVACDALTFKEVGALAELGSGDGRAFAGINKKMGIVTTSDGAYILDLEPLCLREALEGSQESQCGGVYVSDRNVFVISQSKGILVYDINSLTLVKEYPKGEVGFARTKDGDLWAAHQNVLIRINTSFLGFEEVTMPEEVVINNSWGSWNAGPLCASTHENALYFTKSGTWGGGREIYRYKVGDLGSLNSVFATSSATDDAFYGSGIEVDPVSGDIIATMVKEGWGDSYQDNRLVIFDGATGVEKSRKTFQGYWFPAMVVFKR